MEAIFVQIQRCRLLNRTHNNQSSYPESRGKGKAERALGQPMWLQKPFLPVSNKHSGPRQQMRSQRGYRIHSQILDLFTVGSPKTRRSYEHSTDKDSPDNNIRRRVASTFTMLLSGVTCLLAQGGNQPLWYSVIKFLEEKWVTGHLF